MMRLSGAKDSQIEAVSFGEEKPKAAGHDETSWAENRRSDFAPDVSFSSFCAGMRVYLSPLVVAATLTLPILFASSIALIAQEPVSM